jgi:proline iminopeptidase
VPYVDHKFGKTYFQVRGSKRARGLPLVCLHGGPGGYSRYMTDLFALSGDRQVFIYDQIGGGRSSEIASPRWTIKTFVDELKHLRAAWGLDQFHLFGGSWGTTLALEYYLRVKRNGVQSLIFQSPMFSTADWEKDARKLIRGLPEKEQKVIRYCHEIDATDSKVYEKAMKVYYAKHVCRNRAKAKRPSVNPNGNKVYAGMWGPSEFKATGTLKNYDQVDSLGRISCPTLFICGEHDEARPETARRYTRKVQEAEFVEIKGASHAILAENPKRLTRTIKTFINRHDN